MKALLLTLALAGVTLQTDHGLELAELGVHGDEQGVTATKGCGAFCVAIAARRAGHAEVSFAEVTELTDPDDDGDCSLADIVSALNELGIDALPRHSATRTIPSGLSILHVRSSPQVAEPDHFVVAEGSAAGRHRFYIPPVGAGIDDDDRMVALWDGNYVFLATGPESRTRFLVTAVLSAFVGVTVAFSLRRRLQGSEVSA